jgi:predicted N-acetyltransferase YhbS
MENLSYREMTPADSPALEAIMSASPDAGLVGFTNDYRHDLVAVHRALAPDLRGAVALHEDRVIGMVFGDMVQVQWAGELRQAVYLSNLRVHPKFRRRGVARGLAEWGFSYAQDLLGPQAIFYGAVTQGNISLALAKRYQFQASAPIQGGTVPMRKRPPGPQPGLDVRPALEADLPAIAEGMNAYYRQHDLWSPVSPSGLKRFLEQSVSGVRPNQLYVVARGEQILGGLSLSDRTDLIRMRISSAPAWVRLLGGVLGILPSSGVLRALTARRVWFKEGELQAGRYLWQQLRYQLRERGNCLGIAYDPRDQLAQLFQIPFWLPMFKARYLVRGPGMLDTRRLIYCLAGP